MAIGTIGEAWSLGWRIDGSSASGRRRLQRQQLLTASGMTAALSHSPVTTPTN